MVTGARPPYEDQTRPEHVDNESEESTDEDETGHETELSMRLQSIIDLVRDLYKLGFKIRDPNLRTGSLKANGYRQVDPETGIDLFDIFSEFDQRHTFALLQALRQPKTGVMAGSELTRTLPPVTGAQSLLARLASSVTLRRKHFRYWEKHSKKLSASSVQPEQHRAPVISVEDNSADPLLPQAEVVSGNADQSGPAVLPPADLGNLDVQSEHRTLLSMTEATLYKEAVGDRTDTESIVSFASTAVDNDGHGLELPGPPREATEGQDFVCPYCWVMCPAKYGRRKAWRAHVLHDLQPYICTYDSCSTPDRLYRTRKQWIDHEGSEHRSLWRCYQHPQLVYTSPAELKEHLEEQHGSHLTHAQMDSFVGLGRVTTPDRRSICPICLQLAPFARGLENHLAHHLERFALFALPRGPYDDDDDEDGNNSNAQQVTDRSSQDWGDDSDKSELVFSEGRGPHEKEDEGQVPHVYRYTRANGETAYKIAP